MLCVIDYFFFVLRPLNHAFNKTKTHQKDLSAPTLYVLKRKKKDLEEFYRLFFKKRNQDDFSDHFNQEGR